MLCKKRDSNIELLRMLAMFQVLLVHADFYSLGYPSVEHVLNDFLDSFLRFFFESGSIVCVNVFILISGWFGIKPSFKGACNFIFQCVFFLTGAYLVALIIGTSTISKLGIAGCIGATTHNWFIKAYLLLYILSPVLNTFVEHATRKTFKTVLLCFFAFVCTYGWYGAAKFMMGGYSPLFFIGLYLLARYMRLYNPSFMHFKITTDILIYCGVCLFVTFASISAPLFLNRFFIAFYDYISPTCIIAAVYLFLTFSKIRFYCKFVNWCGISCFAVFLLHKNPSTLYHYKNLFAYLHTIYSPLQYWLVTMLILVVIFLLAVTIDKIRILLWRNILLFVEFCASKSNKCESLIK